MRKKTEEKRQSFIKAAGELFLAQGFSAVTIESVAAKAKSSKVTLYSYFSSKEELFEAWATESGRTAFARLVAATEAEASPEEILRNVGVAYLNLITQPEVIATNRLIIGEAERFPHLAKLFYIAGPKNTLNSLIDVIAALIAKGSLKDLDSRLMAINFKATCEGNMLERQLWGLDPNPPESHVLYELTERAVENFMILYQSD